MDFHPGVTGGKTKRRKSAKNKNLSEHSVHFCAFNTFIKHRMEARRPEKKVQFMETNGKDGRNGKKKSAPASLPALP